MSLNWDLTNIEDYKNKCWIEKDNEHNLNPVTEALIFATMSVGLNEITEKNAQEFYIRLHALERLMIPYLTSWDDDGSHPRFIEWEDINDHIGLHTNASTMTPAQYRKHLFEVFDREVKRGRC